MSKLKLYTGEKSDKEGKRDDVIVASAILGFTLTRFYLDQPCQFDVEHPTKEQQKQWEEIERTDGEYLRRLEDILKAKNEAIEIITKTKDKEYISEKTKAILEEKIKTIGYTKNTKSGLTVITSLPGIKDKETQKINKEKIEEIETELCKLKEKKEDTGEVEK